MRSLVKERTKIHPSHRVSYSACIQEAGWGSLVWEANQVAFFENWQMCLVSLAIRVNRDRQDNTILSTLKTMARHHKPCRGLIILEPLPFSPPLLSIIKKPNPSFWSRYLLEWHIQVTCFRLQRYTAAQSSGGAEVIYCWEISPLFNTSWVLDALEHVWRYHDWSGIPRDSDHCPEWRPGGGRGGTALLLYLQTGWFTAPGWTWHLLRGTECLRPAVSDER